MTAQISDDIQYRGRPFDIAGLSGGPLFEPQSYGLKPQMLSTACWRGFYCTFAVEEESLRLKQLTVGLSPEDANAASAGKGPVLFGKTPVKSKWEGFVYEGLSAVLPFTGGLLLADGFMRELYVHMGFHPAWKYREVHELIFEEGRLVRTMDRSTEMAQLRERLAQGPLKPGPRASQEAIEAWIEKCFSLQYK